MSMTETKRHESREKTQVLERSPAKKRGYTSIVGVIIAVLAVIGLLAIL